MPALLGCSSFVDFMAHENQRFRAHSIIIVRKLAGVKFFLHFGLILGNQIYYFHQKGGMNSMEEQLINDVLQFLAGKYSGP